MSNDDCSAGAKAVLALSSGRFVMVYDGQGVQFVPSRAEMKRLMAHAICCTF